MILRYVLLISVLMFIYTTLPGTVVLSAPFDLDNVPPTINVLSIPLPDTLFVGSYCMLSWNVTDLSGDSTYTGLKFNDGMGNSLHLKDNHGTNTSFVWRVPAVFSNQGEMSVSAIDMYRNQSNVVIANHVKIDFDKPLPPRGITVRHSAGKVVLDWQEIDISARGFYCPPDFYLIYRSCDPDPTAWNQYHLIDYSWVTSYEDVESANLEHCFYFVSSYKLENFESLGGWIMQHEEEMRTNRKQQTGFYDAK